MINNRQNGRRRGRGGQRPQGNGGGGGQGQRDSGNRIDSRARGNASQLYEKYKNMAADAQRQGDRVNTEYYLQFADHYFRVMADQRGRYEDQGQQRRQHTDFDSDEEYGDEGEPVRAEEQGRASEDRSDRNDRNDRNERDGRQADGNRQRYDRGDRNDRGDRSDRGDRNERSDRGERNDRDDNGYRADPRGDAEGRQGNRQRYSTQRIHEPRRDERTPVAASAEDAIVEQPAVMTDEGQHAESDMAAAPKRRGRPRKTVDAAEQTGLDVSALPPSIGSAEPAADHSEEAAPKPRRRRSVVTAAPDATPAPEVTTAS